MGINRIVERNKKEEEELLDYGYGTINHMATIFIIKYVDKTFSPVYWIEHTHGSIDYNEMPKLILHQMKEQLKIFLPLTLEKETLKKAYIKIDETLNKLPNEKRNDEYIDTHKIDINEINKAIIDIFLQYFQANKKNNIKDK